MPIMQHGRSLRTRPVPPNLAAAVGYRALTFDGTFASSTVDTAKTLAPGFNWYAYNYFGGSVDTASIVVNGDGSVTLTGDPTGPNGTITTAAQTGTGTFVGRTFGGGAYFEAEIKIDPTDTSVGWPSFWALAIEHCADMAAQHWPGQVAGYNHFIECDIFEFLVDTSSYIGGLHDWSGVDSGSGYPNNVLSDTARPYPSGIDFTQYHRYGALWVPATASSSGYVDYYFNRIKVGARAAWWNLYVGQPPSTPTSVFLPTRTSDSAGWQGFTLRQVVPASQLAPATSGNIRVGVQVGVGAHGTVTSVWVGKRSGVTGSDYDGNQIQLLFNGQPSITIVPGGMIIYSDPIAFSYDDTQDMVFSAHFQNSPGDVMNIELSNGVTGCEAFEKFTDGVDEAGITSGAGYTTDPADQCNFIHEITVEETGAYQSWSVMDAQHFPLILGTGIGWPMTVRNVKVWQATGNSNWNGVP